MFYIRSMMEESPGAHPPAGDVFAFSTPPDEAGAEKNAKTEKRIRSVQSGKPRGGQKGNRNALKAGKFTGKRKAERRDFRAFRHEVRDLMAEAKLLLATERLRR
ncbi:MAG TPA: hypothetical protein VHU87_01755 [Rhizomicrobium sp.]|nr:hypothetical protein [Rhizomicrobium sp.]